MKQVKRYMRLYRVMIAQFFKTMMQSKVDFLLGLSGFFFTQLSGIFFLYLVFEQIPDLQGWSLEQLIFIYGFAQIPRGIDHLLTDNLWLVAWRLVINGDFDRYMLRPMNVLFQVIAEKLQPDALGELLVGTILVIRSVVCGVVAVTPINVLLFVISVLAGSLIYTAIKILFSSLAFWIKRSGPFLQLAYDLANFAKYPTQIYAKGIQFLITWVIPFAFVAYLPASYFLRVENSAWVIGVECAIALAFWLISTAVFRKGIRIYESAGN